MRKISITDKLIIASLLISVLTITVVASYSFYNAKKAILNRTFNQLNSVRVIKTNLIETFFYNCFKEVGLAAASSDIRFLVKQINEINKPEKNTPINDFKLGKSRKFINELSQEHYSRIFIIGKNKLIYPLKNSCENNTSANCKEFYNEGVTNNDVFVKDYTKNKNDSFANLTICKTIKDGNNEILGILVFEIPSIVIDKIMLNDNPASGLGASGESYLVGSDYLMRSSSRFQEKSILKTFVKTKAVQSVLNNKPGTKLIKDYRNIEVLSSYDKINVPNLHWVILAEIDYKEVTIPIYKIRNEIIFISIFIFLIVMLVVIILSKKITFPIQKLNQAAHEVGTGNLDVEIHNISDDEIGELTETFNHMVKQLKTQAKELGVEKTKSLRSLIDGQEIERQRLSRELHDSLGQLLIALKLKFESSLPKNTKITDAQLNLGNLFDNAIEETRRISNNLMPAALSEFGLITAIRNICNDVSETSNIKIKFNKKGESKNLTSEIKIYLFRIIQETMTNIVKHSEAKNVQINLEFSTKKILVNIKDDGKGFDIVKDKKENSNGLNNIIDRVSLLNGKFKIFSERKKGTTIIIEIPINT